jgi:HEAT repeat protein
VRQAHAEAEYRAKPQSDAVRRAGGDVAKLLQALADSDPVTRYQAVGALGSAKAATAAPALTATAQSDAEWIVRRTAVQALGALGGGRAVQTLGALLTAPKSDLARFAAQALGEIDSAAVPMLTNALTVADGPRWEAVAGALVRIGGPAAVPGWQRILGASGGHAVSAQRITLAALRKQPEKALFDSVMTLLARVPAPVRTDAASALGAYKDARAIEPLIALLDDKSDGLHYAKKEAMFALEAITGRDGTQKGRDGGDESAAAWRALLTRGDKASATDRQGAVAERTAFHLGVLAQTRSASIGARALACGQQPRLRRA